MLRKKIVEEYLRFSRADRIAVLCLTAMTLIIYFLPGWLVRGEQEFPLKPGSALARAIDSLNASAVPESTLIERPGKPGETRKTSLFSFDPNTLDETGWRSLGLPERTITTILHYTSRGGRFRKPEDLQKVWGLPRGFYEKVRDSIRIRNEERPANPAFTPGNLTTPRPARAVAIDINHSDTADWMALPGIGAKLAGRIISFREKLGGFVSTDQVGEVYGLRDSVFQKIRSNLHGGGSVKTLKINQATKDELKQHPYLRWSLANAIVNYREQHGKFKSVEELKNITLIDEKLFEKIKSYISVE